MIRSLLINSFCTTGMHPFGMDKSMFQKKKAGTLDNFWGLTPEVLITVSFVAQQIFERTMVHCDERHIFIVLGSLPKRFSYNSEHDHVCIKDVCKRNMRTMDMDIESEKRLPTISHAGDTIYTEGCCEERRNGGMPPEKSLLVRKKTTRSHRRSVPSACTCCNRNCHSRVALYCHNRCFPPSAAEA